MSAWLIALEANERQNKTLLLPFDDYGMNSYMQLSAAEIALFARALD
ncbi:MAG: hypothetical protein AB1427_09395 [Thermodesulfobacteriota bacterium]